MREKLGMGRDGEEWERIEEEEIKELRTFESRPTAQKLKK